MPLNGATALRESLISIGEGGVWINQNINDVPEAQDNIPGEV